VSEFRAERPTPPPEPDPDACCGSGCAVCVWDRYQEALDRYREQLKAWQNAPDG
jgi:hypothetical protein